MRVARRRVTLSRLPFFFFKRWQGKINLSSVQTIWTPALPLLPLFRILGISEIYSVLPNVLVLYWKKGAVNWDLALDWCRSSQSNSIFVFSSNLCDIIAPFLSFWLLRVLSSINSIQPWTKYTWKPLTQPLELDLSCSIIYLMKLVFYFYIHWCFLIYWFTFR